jgi:hypothetical protein
LAKWQIKDLTLARKDTRMNDEEIAKQNKKGRDKQRKKERKPEKERQVSK